MPPPPTVAEALREAESTLAAAGIDAPRQHATALLGHVLGLDRARLMSRLREVLHPASHAEMERLVGLRSRHHPLQYLIGRAEFLDFEVAVRPGVFVPRPETEQLVGRALELWDPEHPWALDLCTGSGVVAIALARERPAARILAIDVSPLALRAAAQNVRSLGLEDRIRLLRADLLTSLVAAAGWARLGLLTCNPPYAARGDVVQPEVRDHEPELAWSAGPTGLEVYERLVPQAAALLVDGRPLVLELGWGQEQRVPDLLADDGAWSAPRIDVDFQGIPRVLSTTRLPR